MLLMSKQVSLLEIGSILQKVKLAQKLTCALFAQRRPSITCIIYYHSEYLARSDHMQCSFLLIMFYQLILTIFLCSLIFFRTLWSITNRSVGQQLKFVFCVLIQPSDNFVTNWSTSDIFYSLWLRRAFLFVKQFKSFDDSFPVIWWW